MDVRKAAALGGIALLLVTKVHVLGDETDIVIASPLSMPIDSARATCFRKYDQSLFECGLAFAAAHSSAAKLLTLPKCAGCGRFAEKFSAMWIDPETADRRRAQLDEFAERAASPTK